MIHVVVGPKYSKNIQLHNHNEFKLHWVGAEFGVFKFTSSRDQSLNLFQQITKFLRIPHTNSDKVNFVGILILLRILQPVNINVVVPGSVVVSGKLIKFRSFMRIALTLCRFRIQFVEGNSNLRIPFQLQSTTDVGSAFLMQIPQFSSNSAKVSVFGTILSQTVFFLFFLWTPKQHRRTKKIIYFKFCNKTVVSMMQTKRLNMLISTSVCFKAELRKTSFVDRISAGHYEIQSSEL